MDAGRDDSLLAFDPGSPQYVTMPSRRTALRRLAASVSTAALAGSGLLPGAGPRRALAQETAAETSKSKICLFTKHLQGLSYDDIASLAAEAGVDGVEAPIRPKGHIEPERVPDELPKFIEALRKQGLELTILTSSINEASATQHAETVLRTAAQLGVKRYRMGYYRYDLEKPIWPQMEAIKPQLRDLIQLSQEAGIQPLYQNHSGRDFVGAPLWDIYGAMREYEAGQFSFAFDILHATVEGGLSWPLHLELASDYLGAAYFKDFRWVGRKLEMCPLGEGQVDPAYAEKLLAKGYEGPVALHVEYLKGDPKDPEVLKAFREAHLRDAAILKKWLGRA